MVAAIAGGIAVGRSIDREKTGLLDVPVDAALEELVEPGGFDLDLLQITEFRADGDAELVGGIPGETELLAVVRFESDGHGDAFPLMVVDMKKPRTPQGAGAVARLPPGEAPSCSMFMVLYHDQAGFSREGTCITSRD